MKKTAETPESIRKMGEQFDKIWTALQQFRDGEITVKELKNATRDGVKAIRDVEKTFKELKSSKN
jgi:hypothetical protein